MIFVLLGLALNPTNCSQIQSSSSCNQECLSFTLNYFPNDMGVQKCGCKLDKSFLGESA